MTVREQLKAEIDTKDNIVNPMDVFQQLADNGGLGISDPLAWQDEQRQERELPGRSE
jgi:hypothetical protein